ncbi:hypothetical protein D3C86_2086190 [compost metagenome]
MSWLTCPRRVVICATDSSAWSTFWATSWARWETRRTPATISRTASRTCSESVEMEALPSSTTRLVRIDSPSEVATTVLSWS